ncbi:MAG: hypothetical protein IKS93_03725 [Methanobrevibacter sp.]|nr:hypothetical protein [Methanobrevibacter sp.]
MQYKLITTRQGQIPIEEIKEGMEVYSMGEWKVSPKPVLNKCIKCFFDTLPTTIFEKGIISHTKEVSVNHYPVIKPTTEFKDELAIRGYFKEDFNPSITHIPFAGYDTITYWYTKFIRLFGETGNITLTENGINLNIKRHTLEELSGEDLTERNLEYYLEGMTRKQFFYSNLKFHLKKTLSESDRIVLRLLDIDCTPSVNDTIVTNEISLLKHIKDDYAKSKITDEQIVYALKKNIELPEYTNGNIIIKKEEVLDWTLPGINPDINCINPLNCYESALFKNRFRYADKYKADGRTNGNYIENSLYNRLFDE